MNNSTKLVLKEAFCPEDPAWRSRLLKRGEAVLVQAYNTVGMI